MENNKNIFKEMENDVKNSDLDELTKEKLLKDILKLKNQKVNLMVTGATGSGKSSTINAMFKTEVAKVGIGVDPETMDIKKYELDNLIIWDTPGLGDGKEKDRQHSKAIIKKLNELDENGKPLIDLVLVILDGGSRDLGTSYELINQVIIPNLGENAKDRILIAINQADVAMKGRYWNFEKNQPEPKLVEFLEKKVKSVKKRVKEATGVEVEPIYYSAGFKDEDEEQKPWNLSKLLYYIVKNTPTEKRLSYVKNISDKKEMWEEDDKLKNYTEEVKKGFVGTIIQEIGKVGAAVLNKAADVIASVGSTVVSGAGKVVSFLTGGLFGW